MPSLNSLAAYRRRGAEVEPPDQAPSDQAPPERPETETETLESESLESESPEPEARAAAPETQAVKPRSQRRVAKRLSRLPSAAAPEPRTARRQRTEDAEPAKSSRPRTGRRTVSTPVRAHRISVVLGAVTVLLGGLAFWSANEAAGLRGGAVQHNAALTDTVRTSQVKGKVADEVNTLFSYDYTDPAKNDQAERSTLTGKAVQQYDSMMATVRQQGAQQKLVLTTTVTYSAVEMLDGDRARILLFADQRNTRAVAKDTTYAAAMLAVDAEYRGGGVWKITNFDTLNVPAQ